jgi:hypothetical protein
MRSAIPMLVVLLTVTACSGHVAADQSAGVGADAASTREDAPFAEDASFEGSSYADVAFPVPLDATITDVAALDAVAETNLEIDALANAVCPADVSPIWPWGSSVQGSIEGPNVSATLCPNTFLASASPAFSADGGVSFEIAQNTNIVIGIPFLPIVSLLPANAIGGSLTVFIPIADAYPATYGNGSCGWVEFQLGLSETPPVDCDSGVIGSDGICPDGCSPTCHRPTGCQQPCVPQNPFIDYWASGECNSQAGQGSYTLAITSLEPLIDAGSLYPGYLTVHGTLNATVVNVDGGTDTAEIQATF